MFPAPSPSAGRGDIVLQPNYFTSSVYVKALRDDISTLILRYHEAYSQSGSVKPFAVFKTVWLGMGWNWLHFKVFDDRSRQTFLDVTTRLFLGMCSLGRCWMLLMRSGREDCKDRGPVHESCCVVWHVHVLLYTSERPNTCSSFDLKHTYPLRQVAFIICRLQAEHV